VRYSLRGYKGEEEAGKWRDILAKEMTPTQIAEVQKLARDPPPEALPDQTR
jgi:hypothetical protein